MVRDGSSVVQRLTQALGLSQAEAEAYLRALEEGSLRAGGPGGPKDGSEGRLLARGMLILSSDGRSLLPVHPRLAISNLFRSSSPDRASAEVKARRRMADKLTLELIPAFEAGRGRE